MLMGNLVENSTYYQENINFVIGLAILTRPSTPITVPNFFLISSHYYVYDYIATHFNVKRYF